MFIEPLSTSLISLFFLSPDCVMLYFLLYLILFSAGGDGAFEGMTVEEETGRCVERRSE